MKKKQLLKLGIPDGAAARAAMRAVSSAAKAGMGRNELRSRIEEIVASPGDYVEDPLFKNLAECLVAGGETREDARARRDETRPRREERKEPAPYRKWGTDLDANAVEQMDNACRIPVSVAGALMPDAHMGYGLPIGGVLATDNAVIPYAVGVDIACRMKMTVLDLPVSALERQRDRLVQALRAETLFGVGAAYPKTDRRRHPVVDEDWSFSPVTAQCQDKAWGQLGTSGSGNHFAEFGTLTLEKDDLGLKAGVYLALLSHSGSRGTGAAVAQHYSRLAKTMHPELPRELSQLAWLDLDTAEGQEYWMAMELMGRYAAANHELIHRAVVKHLGAGVLLDLENHHNFAWREEHQGRRVIVHRKGATPAGRGVIGIIPGSMGTPGYVARGKGQAESLNSAAHGAGRRMSRKEAMRRFRWKDIQAYLAERGIELISAGLDEAPMAYKDIDAVMAAQQDLVQPIARFDPKLVKMAPAGERPED
jgi:tRNA-splicing ligase RtcB